MGMESNGPNENFVVSRCAKNGFRAPVFLTRWTDVARIMCAYAIVHEKSIPQGPRIQNIQTWDLRSFYS